jgi:NAD(P)-dependent dehydrogenase (short-subunit alcohol dehydrogenase family)
MAKNMLITDANAASAQPQPRLPLIMAETSSPLVTIRTPKGARLDRADMVCPNVQILRSGTSNVVADAILWRASDVSSYTTGTFIEVSGATHI